MFFIEVLELLWCLSLKGGFPGQALEHNGPYTPQVRLGIVLEGHYHFRSLQRKSVSWSPEDITNTRSKLVCNQKL